VYATCLGENGANLRSEQMDPFHFQAHGAVHKLESDDQDQRRL